MLAVAGYVMFVGAIEYYSPLTPGLANRTNAIASIGFIGAVYAVAVLAGTLLFRGLPGWRPLSAVTAVAVAGFLFAGYQDRVRDSAAVWDRAYAQEQMVLGAVRAGLPELPPRSVVLTFGHPTVSENPGLPIFSSFWELRSAVQVVYDDPSLDAYPALPDTQVVCTQRGAHFTGGGYDEWAGAEYGRVYLLDVAGAKVRRLRSPRECRAAVPEFHPGPPQASPPAP